MNDMEISNLFKKKMIEFKFIYDIVDGLEFKTEDANDYFEKAISLKDGISVCYNGASYSIDIIYDAKKLLNTSSHRLSGERITAYGFCSTENIEACKKQFCSEVKVLIHKRIKELESIKNQHISQLDKI
jgi:hypothetical protein